MTAMCHFKPAYLTYDNGKAAVSMQGAHNGCNGAGPGGRAVFGGHWAESSVEVLSKPPFSCFPGHAAVWQIADLAERYLNQICAISAPSPPRTDTDGLSSGEHGMH